METSLRTDFLKQIKEITTQLANIGKPLEESKGVQMTHNALPKSFEGFIQAVLGGNQMSTFDKLSIELLLEEQRRENKHHTNIEASFVGGGRSHGGYTNKEVKPQKDEEDGTQGGVSTTKIKMMGIITPMGIVRITLGALGTIIIVIDLGIEGGSAFFPHLTNLINKSMLFMKRMSLMQVPVKRRMNHLTCWIVRTTTPHKALTIGHRDSTNGLYKLEIATPQTAH
jgi:hypothetical protein